MKKTQPKPCQNQKLHLDYSLEERLLSRLTREAQSRERLCRVLNISDRDLRRTVRELRNQGYPVLSSSTKKGYWIGSRIECQELAMEYKSRARDMLKTARRLESIELDGQEGSWRN